LNNIVLYGDGQDPGEIKIGPHENHQIHIERLQSFMARPEYWLASPKVRAAFERALEERKVQMGVYPEQLQSPEAILAGEPPPGAEEEMGMGEEAAAFPPPQGGIPGGLVGAQGGGELSGFIGGPGAAPLR